MEIKSQSKEALGMYLWSPNVMAPHMVLPMAIVPLNAPRVEIQYVNNASSNDTPVSCAKKNKSYPSTKTSAPKIDSNSSFQEVVSSVDIQEYMAQRRDYQRVKFSISFQRGLSVTKLTMLHF